MDASYQIYTNPWAGLLTENAVLGALEAAARQLIEELRRHSPQHAAGAEPPSYGLVLLDPTRPRSAATLKERLFAAIMVGPHGHTHLPAALAAVDLHDRFSWAGHQLAVEFRHLLNQHTILPGGYSASYHIALAGGAGLEGTRNTPLIAAALKVVIDGIEERLSRRPRAGAPAEAAALAFYTEVLAGSHRSQMI